MVKHLYIHIPFCDSICSYCDFCKRVSNESIMKEYLNKIEEEILSYKEELNNLETIFIGGGTPTAFLYLEDLLIFIKNNINLSYIKEYTIESRLDSLIKYIPILKGYGINRVSIGIESLNKEAIEYINRRYYSKEKIKDIIKSIIDNGINNINLDFIKGLPYETFDSIKESIELIKESGVTHVSYYDLIIEEKTKLFHDLKHFKVTVPSEDELILFSDYINKELENMGINRYEVSNYSKKGFESIHNSSYWLLEDYIGVGASAHSLLNNKRFYNTSDIKEYLYDNKPKEEEFEEEKEYIILGLRLTKGINLKEYKKKYNIDFFVKYPTIIKYVEYGLLDIKNDNLYFTYKGFDLMNQVLKEF